MVLLLLVIAISIISAFANDVSTPQTRGHAGSVSFLFYIGEVY